MNGSWVCTACRRRLLASRLRHHPARHVPRRFNASAALDQPRDDHAPREVPVANEDDEIDRDFFARHIQPRGLSSGPYSSPYRKAAVRDPRPPAQTSQSSEPRPPLFAAPTNSMQPRYRELKSQAVHFAWSSSKRASPHQQPITSNERGSPEHVSSALAEYRRVRDQTDRHGKTTHKMSASLVRTLTRAWIEWPDSTDIPSPSAVWSLTHHVWTAKGRLTVWSDCMMSLLLDTPDPTPSSYSTHLTDEIGAMWRCLMRDFGELDGYNEDGRVAHKTGSEAWTDYLQSEQARQIREWSSKSLATRLGMFLAPSANKALDDTPMWKPDLFIPASLAHLKKHSKPKPSEQGLVEFLGLMITHSSAKDMRKRVKFHEFLKRRGWHTGRRDALWKDIEDAMDSVLVDNPALRSVGQEASNNVRDREEVIADLYTKRLGRALEAGNVHRARQLFDDIKREFPDVRGGIPKAVYLSLMTTFMGLRRPNDAVHVWNQMTDAGVAPGLDHWDAMLRGCGVARDGIAAEQMWARIIASGAEPDVRLWASRIFCQSSCGRHEKAMDVFETMVAQWEDSLDTGASAPKPNILCVNHLVAGLARARNNRDLMRVFNVVKALNIKVDIYTFNPLFRAALRDGDTDVAVRLLKRMNSMGIKPDVATFTLVIAAAFEDEATADLVHALSSPGGSNTGHAAIAGPKDEGVAKVSGAIEHHVGGSEGEKIMQTVLAMMDAAGLAPTAHTFSTVVSGLVKREEQQRNIHAAYAVMGHMMRIGVRPPAQVYTTLARYHFGQQPPDLTSVEALWHHARQDRGQSGAAMLDGYFYDRFVNGWTEVGNVPRALESLLAARKAGKMVGWPSLGGLVEALLMAGERQRAETLAREAVEIEGEMEDGEGRGKELFIDRWQQRGLLAS